MSNHASEAIVRGLRTSSTGPGVAGRFSPDRELPLPDSAWRVIAAGLHLTRRETQIVRGVLDNLGTADIAAGLNIQPRTVRAHLEQVYRKHGLRSRSELVLMIFAATLQSWPLVSTPARKPAVAKTAESGDDASALNTDPTQVGGSINHQTGARHAVRGVMRSQGRSS